MKKPTLSELLQAILFAAVMAAICFGYTHLVSECEGRGGVLVRTMGGYECLAVERR